MNSSNVNRLMATLLAATLLQGFNATAADEPADKPAAAPPAPTTPVPNPAPGTADTGRQGRRQPGGNIQGGRGNAQDPAINFPRGGGVPGFNFNFDDKQRELLREARQGGNDELRKLNETLAEAQKDYVKSVVAEKYDENSVREKANVIGRIQAQILALNGKSFATVSPTLKPEQRETLEGNTRLAIGIISPAVGGIGGNFAAGPGAGFGGGRGSFGPGGGPGGDPAAGGGRGGRGGNFGPGGNAGGDPASPNQRRRGGDNQGQ